MGSVTGIDSKKKTGKNKRGKSNFLMKGVRAKLTSTWEGGGVGGKKHTKNYFLIRGPIPTSTPVGNRVKMGLFPPFQS